MGTNFKIPARFSMKVMVTNGKDKTGELDIDLPIGVYPTKDSILEWIKEGEKQAKKHDNNLRIVAPNEFSELISFKETGERIKVVGSPEKWEDLE